MLGWLFSAAALAESWCAAPLVVHEWGVVRLGAKDAGVPVPAWFARSSSAPERAGPRVRDLPADSGERDLPVISLYGAGLWSYPIPFALEVGFASGAPTVWWPPADALTGATLSWESLALAPKPGSPPRAATEPWVDRLRALPEALWVDRGADSERFVFYEGRTVESSALVLRRGDSWSPARPHYLVENVSDHVVHDVVIVADGLAWTAPSVPAHKSAGFLLTDPLDAKALRAGLRAGWSGGAPPEPNSWGPDCVMMRDPAVPVERSVDHRLYADEIDVLLDTWEPWLFRTDGSGSVHLLYREDVGAIDAAVPIKLYTDMYHWVDLHRLSVVLVDGVRLP